MKDVLATIGACFIILLILGALNIGHFRMYYGADTHGCAKMEEKLQDQEGGKQ
jgi:hypothetical protein